MSVFNGLVHAVGGLFAFSCHIFRVTFVGKRGDTARFSEQNVVQIHQTQHSKNPYIMGKTQKILIFQDFLSLWEIGGGDGS